jgi:hypothetical protein
MRYFYRPQSPHADQHGFVPEQYAYEEPGTMALHAPIMVDRFYENTCASDGTDIGSRRKHRAYMKANNLTTADDFKGAWSEASRERETIRAGQHDKKERREQIERALYQRNRP